MTVNEHEALDPILTFECVPERDRPAHRDPDEARPLDVESVEQAIENRDGRFHRVVGGVVALAVARKVGSDHAMVLGEMREVVFPRDARRVETDAVEQDHALPFAGGEISDTDRFAIDIDPDPFRLHANQSLVHTDFSDERGYERSQTPSDGRELTTGLARNEARRLPNRQWRSPAYRHRRNPHD